MNDKTGYDDEHAAQYAVECAKADEWREYARANSKTIRDEFACAALTGLLARAISLPDDPGIDAMLAERAK